jgi:hypothetical protein
MPTLGFGPAQPVSQTQQIPRQDQQPSNGFSAESTEQDWQKKSPWFNKYWRAGMAWSYFTVTVCDFIIFPILWNIAQIYTKGQLSGWVPLTLQNGGLYHLAMGAVLGVSAFGRTKENLARASR